MTTSPTIFHITHWKAGSQWVAEILKHSARDRFVPWKVTKPHSNLGQGLSEFRVKPLRVGKIYGTVYLPYSKFEAIVYGFSRQYGQEFVRFPRRTINNWWNFRVRQSPFRCFFLMRDMRDVLVSFYFSEKNSHPVDADIIARRKQKLNELNEEDGFLYLIDEVLPDVTNIQTSWINVKNVLTLRYEDILGNEYAFFEKLLDYCEINIPQQQLRDIVGYNVFESVTGRKRGEENVNAHLRKGIAGDWHNYFTDKIKDTFKKQYGQVLITTGYEKDMNW